MNVSLRTNKIVKSSQLRKSVPISPKKVFDDFYRSRKLSQNELNEKDTKQNTINDINELAVIAPSYSRNSYISATKKEEPSRFIRAMNRVDLMRKSSNFTRN